MGADRRPGGSQCTLPDASAAPLRSAAHLPALLGPALAGRVTARTAMNAGMPSAARCHWELAHGHCSESFSTSSPNPGLYIFSFHFSEANLAALTLVPNTRGIRKDERTGSPLEIGQC